MDLETILRELNCTDGFSIPIANEENKKLEQEIKIQKDAINVVSSELEETKERLQCLKKYSASVRNENAQCQKLVFAQEQQLSVEINFHKLNTAEVTGYGNERKKLLKQLKEMKERKKLIEHDLEKCFNRVKKLNVALKWDQDALKTWENEMHRVEEDAAFLDTFMKKDKLRFEELELKRRLIREEVDAKQFIVERLNNEVICLEQSLEKTGTLFQRQHEDRQQLIHQWNSSVRVFHEREKEINRLIEEIAAVKTQAKKRLRDLKEHRTFYETERENNLTNEKELAHIGKKASLTKAEMQELTDMVADLKRQVLTMRGIVSSSAQHCEIYRTKNHKLSQQIFTNNKLCEELGEHIELLQKTEEEAKGKNISAADRVRRLQDILNDDEAVLQSVIHKHKKLQETMKKANDDLMVYKDREKQQESEMENIESMKHKLHNNKLRALKELENQKRYLYDLDIAITKQEVTLRQLVGAYDPDEKLRLETKLNELSRVFKEVDEARLMLEKECFRLDQEHRRLINAVEQEHKELALVREKKQEFVLQVEGAIKELKLYRTQNQERQLDQNLLKLKLKQMENTLQNADGKLLDLEKQRLALDECEKERFLELKAASDCLNVRKRCLQEQLSNLHYHLNLAHRKVDHLQSKYEVTVGSLSGSSNPEEMQNIAYYKIKAAQERMELQMYGDRLDEKVRKTEKELTALENTLKIVHGANKIFKSNLSKPLDDDLVFQQLKELKDITEKETKGIEERRQYLDTLKQSARKLDMSLKELEIVQEEVLSKFKQQNEEAKVLQRDLQDQEEKLTRAWKILKKFIRDVGGTSQTGYQTQEEKDIQLRDILEQNKSALQHLAEATTRYIDVEPIITKYLTEKGIFLHDTKQLNRLLSARSASSSTLPSLSKYDPLYVAKSKRRVPHRSGGRESNLTENEVSALEYVMPSQIQKK